jgi:hypothetical protein
MAASRSARPLPAMTGAGPLSPAGLAERTGIAERYVREWLNAQAAGGYVEYDPDSGRYTLPPEQAVALTDPESLAYLPGFFQNQSGPNWCEINWRGTVGWTGCWRLDPGTGTTGVG